EIQDSVLKGLISCAHKRSRGTYGPLRLQEELAAENQQVGRDHICRLRKEMGLKCIQHKKFKVTTDSQHHLPVAANLLQQEFSVSLPSTVWGTDITYIATDEGWLYLAGVKDFATREIVGYAMAGRMTTQLVQDALKKALPFSDAQRSHSGNPGIHRDLLQPNTSSFGSRQHGSLRFCRNILLTKENRLSPHCPLFTVQGKQLPDPYRGGALPNR